jgi:hypothetical protein
LVDAEKACDPVQGPVWLGYQLPVAQNENPVAFHSAEKIGQLFVVPAEAPVVPKWRPSGGDPAVFGVPGCDEVRLCRATQR